MNIFASTAPRVNSDFDDEPAFEPEAPAPSEEDALWAAETSPFAEEDFDTADDDRDGIDESAAFESAAMDAIERGMIPPDLAEWIARTSPVGHPA